MTFFNRHFLKKRVRVLVFIGCVTILLLTRSEGPCGGGRSES